MLSYALLASLPLLASACHPDYHNIVKRQAAAATATAPPLASLSGGMMTVTVPIPTTATAGAQPSLTGAPALPAYTYVPGTYPAQDVTPPVDSPEVKAWVAAIDWTKVPDYKPNTGPALCTSNPEALAAAKERGWWTCGQHTVDTDIVTCPDKGTWGTSFDDGPSVSTPLLLDYLEKNNLKTTFFVIGSRILGQPDILRREHMLGHEIAGHTWAHPQLTTLTNEQVVAELGWTRKIIKDILGITILTFRPPQGDIDNRVRAIAAQMQLQPVMWSSADEAGTQLFDTGDFNVNAGLETATEAFTSWKTFLDTNLPKMNTGFISLEHDLYPVTVDLAVYYFLPDALSRSNPALKLTSIIECQGKAISESYLETAQNLVFSNASSPASGASVSGSSSQSSTGVVALSSAASQSPTSSSPAVVVSGSSTGMSTSTRASSGATATGSVNAAAASSGSNMSGASSLYSAGSFSVVALGLVGGAFALLL